ncbi:MAG TPA: hypothetical protein VKJ01_02170, partial [Candidatus Solibacter sp.]|nr:hypothetical protein [Candidatus Solibacter sp.]
EAAQALAYRVMSQAPVPGSQSGGGFRDRLNYAYEVTLGRQPSTREAERMGKYFDEASRTLQASPQTVSALFPNQFPGVPQADAAAWVELSRVLLNLDEFITKD